MIFERLILGAVFLIPVIAGVISGCIEVKKNGTKMIDSYLD